jgi:hypothetical protein
LDLYIQTAPMMKYISSGSSFSPRLKCLPIIRTSCSCCFDALYLGPE